MPCSNHKNPELAQVSMSFSQRFYLFADADVSVEFFAYLFRVAINFSAEAGAGRGTAFSSTMLRALNFLP